MQLENQALRKTGFLEQLTNLALLALANGLSLFTRFDPLFFFLVFVLAVFNPIIPNFITLTSALAIGSFLLNSILASKPWRMDKLFFLFVLIACLSLVSAMLGENFARSINLVLRVAFLPFLYLLTFDTIHSRNRLKILLSALLIAACCQAVICILQFQLTTGILTNKLIATSTDELTIGAQAARRASGTWDSNFVSSLLIGILPVSVAFFFTARGALWKACHGAVMVVICVALIYTFSRAAIVALLGAATFVVLKTIFKPSVKKITILLTAMLIIASVLFAGQFIFKKNFLAAYLNRIKTIGYLFKYEYIDFSDPEHMSIAFRVVHVREALRILRENPFFGSGPGTSKQILTKRVHPFYAGNIHNMVLLAASEYGLLVLLLYVVLVGMIWHNYRVSEKRAIALGDRTLLAFILALQTAIVASLVVYQAQPVIFPMQLMIYYNLSSVLRYRHELYLPSGDRP